MTASEILLIAVDTRCPAKSAIGSAWACRALSGYPAALAGRCRIRRTPGTRSAAPPAIAVLDGIPRLIELACRSTGHPAKADIIPPY